MNAQKDQALIGESPAFLSVLDQVSRAAPLRKPVLVIGERGTGKELIAARLHYLSQRWDRPFVKLNCAALAESLLETELFGHEAGAFTGAAKRRLGRFELANEGSLFLDELANTSSRIQEKILRVIEYGDFERVGGSETVTTDVRIIGATNEDLPHLAASGRFRADLLDRLAFDVITLPPLRERQEDILLLAQHFAVKMAGELGQDLFPGFSETAQAAIQAYHWPGNVRELKNVIERAVYRNPEPDQAIQSLEFDPFASPWRPVSSAADGKTIADNPGADTEPAVTIAHPPKTEPFDFKQEVQDIEVEMLKNALAQNKYNQRKTADFLGLTYHQLRGYLRKYDISDSED